MPGAIGQDSYPQRHHGALLIVGSAPCASDDFTQALAMYPSAKVMAVNEGAGIVPVDFIASLHVEGFNYFKKLQRRCFNNEHFTTHAACPDAYFEDVDYYWRGAHTGATSAWCAVLIGKTMGFSTLVLCGCPLNGGDGYGVKTAISKDGPRIGFMAPETPLLLSYRRAMKDAVEAGQGRDVYSMSGYTRELLGPPPGRIPKRAQER